ncbi:psbP-like protein 1, chloroplastic isoform X1 [Actinidia eriantha]|uniref:psbP-like protein 1, chloroplastic isoform X1 n=1 Tax=Actinidia eriantha TaxID=165200 RepID=UPI00258C1338|nr:psbP-like protein 1, chloroplastic isoform X1 [Actinidia eriantha]
MASLKHSPSLHQTWLSNASTQVDFIPRLGVYRNAIFQRGISFLVRAEQISAAPSTHQVLTDRAGRRQLLAMWTTLAPWILLSDQKYASFAAESKKGFLAVMDKKDGYSFLYPFGWQEVTIEGQDKVFKDVIEPLESVSVNMIPTSKQDIRDLGSPQEVAETLIKKVLAPPSQKTKLVEAKEHDEDGKAYYTFEFIAQAPNYTRHALSTICIGNGRFYTLTTGANERRWGKMKDKLQTVVDSFKIVNV